MEFDEYKPFSLLEPEKLHKIKGRIEKCVYSPGDNIIRHGEESVAYYIIQAGSAVVLQKMLREELEQVEVLGPGDGFGEDALLNGTKQNVTVRAIELITVWKISGSDFETVFRPSFLKDVFPEDVEEDRNEDYTILDVRMEEEFEEEYIPGAVNIPLDQLRMRYSELDLGRKYYVCCLAGSRSTTAAFILKSQGIEAMNIKGGMLAWTGPVAKENTSPQESFVPT